MYASQENIACEETAQDYKKVVNRQNETICKLKRKLETYDEVVAERDRLREMQNLYQQWKEKSERDNKKIFSELLTNYNEQTEKLKKIKNDNREWECKYNGLQETNDRISDQLKVMKCNENKLKTQLDDFEKNKKHEHRELCTIKVELEEKNREITKLNMNLKCDEEKFCKLQRQHDECKEQRNQQDFSINILKMDLKDMEAKLKDEKSNATRTEEHLKQEVKTLSEELKIKNRKLRDVEISFNNANRKINDLQDKGRELMTSMIEYSETSKNRQCELMNQIQKLKEDNCKKDNDLSRLKREIKKLLQENECNVTQINCQKEQICTSEKKIKELKLLAEKISKIKETCVPNCTENECERQLSNFCKKSKSCIRDNSCCM